VKIAVLQLLLRPDADSERRALAEATARAVAQGAEVVVAPATLAREGEGDAQALGIIGRVALLSGDAAIDPAEHALLLSATPDVLVLSPGAESDIQAEAVLELAIALSISLASLVIVAERSGAEPGESGHGGSAIVLLGEVLAEALSDEDVLFAEVPVPLPTPAPRAPLPETPPILAQRLAHHRGERMTADYQADLS